jgi:hypothetical protein
LDSNSSFVTEEIQNNFRSGDSFPIYYIALVDKYNTIIGNANDARLVIRVDTSYNNTSNSDE